MSSPYECPRSDRWAHLSEADERLVTPDPEPLVIMVPVEIEESPAA
jgi:hypothetical protein